MSKGVGSLSAGRPSAGTKEKSLASMADKTSMKRVNFEISEEEHTRLKLYAIQQRKTIREVMTDQVRKLIGE